VCSIRCGPLCLRVFVLYTLVSPAEMSKPTKMPFGMWTLGPRNHALLIHGAADPLRRLDTFGDHQCY